MSDDNIIRLKNAVFYAYHGAIKDEQNLGGRFEVDLDLYCDFSEAVREDSLKKTVDYEKVYALLKDLVQEKKYYLIEALGCHIAEGILKNFERVGKVVVRVRKSNPPVKGVMDSVEVEVQRVRQNNS